LLIEVDNPMIDDKEYTVASEQTNGEGVLAQVEGTCRRAGQVDFVATLVAERDAPLGFPDLAANMITGKKRINE